MCNRGFVGAIQLRRKRKTYIMNDGEKLVVLTARNYFAERCGEAPSYHWFNAEIENTDEALLEHIEAQAHASGNLMTEDTIGDIQMRRLEIVLSIMWNG